MEDIAIDCDCHFREHYHDGQGRIVFIPYGDNGYIKLALKTKQAMRNKRIGNKWRQPDNRKQPRG